MCIRSSFEYYYKRTLKNVTITKIQGRKSKLC